MGELTFFLGLQVTQKEDGIFISHDKYVHEIYSDVNSAFTPVDLENPLVKDRDANDVDVYLYRSMIGSLMYLTTSRPDIIFAYPRDSPFELFAYTDSDYAGATQDRKSTSRDCQCLGNKLISWQCKKQTMVATSTTKAEYGLLLVAMDNTICIIENHVQHSKTKHIEIMYHFIRDCNTKKLIQMIKIHTDHNVADLLTKGFDAERFQYLVSREASCVYKQSRMDRRTCYIKQNCVKSQSPRKFKKGRDIKIPQSGGPHKKVGDKAVHIELGDRMERDVTISSSLEAKQDIGSGPRCQDTILRYVEAQARFIQIFLNKHKRLLEPHKSTYVAPTLTQKLFSNMRRAFEGYSGVDVPLFLTMLVQGPNLQSDSTISPPLISSPSRVPTPPYDSPLPGGNTPGSEEGRMTINELTVLCTSLSKKGESLESNLKQIKLTYSAAYSKLIMKVKKLENKVKSRKARRRVRLIVLEDEDDLEDPSKQGKKIAQIDEDKGITLDQMGIQTHTASPEDKTAETSDDSDDITLTETLIEIKRSATKPQKVKGFAFRDVEETPRLIRSTTTLQPLPFIDPKDKGKGVLVEEEPMKVKRIDQGIDDDHKLAARLTYEEQEQFTIKERARFQQQVESSKKRQREVSDEESSKKQKLEENSDANKEELKAILDIVLRDDIVINVESLATKYQIVDWKTYILIENMMFYQILRADGSSKNYKIFSKMLDDFDRQDVINLHRLWKLKLMVQKLMLLVEVKSASTNVNAAEEVNTADENILSILMVDSITFGHEMVNILVLGEKYDKVFNRLDMLNAQFKGKVFTCAKQVKPYVKDKQERDKIRSKPDKNGKRGEAGKSQK
nr:hypothetical protein [Tanacetum cinerariifolium]